MKAVKVEGNKVVFVDEKLEKQKQHQAKLAALSKKKKAGKLTMEDLDAKLDVVLEMLEELLAK